VLLDLNTRKGQVTFLARRGRFRHFRADVVVTQDPQDPKIWRWDGSDRIVRSGEDD
jgi:hypothetical protein